MSAMTQRDVNIDKTYRKLTDLDNIVAFRTVPKFGSHNTSFCQYAGRVYIPYCVFDDAIILYTASCLKVFHKIVTTIGSKLDMKGIVFVCFNSNSHPDVIKVKNIKTGLLEKSCRLSDEEINYVIYFDQAQLDKDVDSLSNHVTDNDNNDKTVIAAEYEEMMAGILYHEIGHTKHKTLTTLSSSYTPLYVGGTIYVSLAAALRHQPTSLMTSLSLATLTTLLAYMTATMTPVAINYCKEILADHHSKQYSNGQAMYLGKTRDSHLFGFSHSHPAHWFRLKVLKWW